MGNRKEINIEDIMKEIRSQIEFENAPMEIPSFDSIPYAGIQSNLDTATRASWDALLSELHFINTTYDIPYYWDFGPRSLKTLAKRVVRKLLKCIIPPILARQVEFNAHTVRCLNAFRYIAEDKCAEMNALCRQVAENQQRSERKLMELREQLAQERQHNERELAMLCEQIAQERKQKEQSVLEIEKRLSQEHSYSEQLCQTQQLQKKETEKISASMAAIARDTIRTKWKVIDFLDSQTPAKDDRIKCGICGCECELESLEKKESACIFDGGKLVRYICPDCGVTFGPVKFSRQSKEEFDDDYTVHYTGHCEGDSTEKEILAFMELGPLKEGVYLNYGCGKWSKTMQILREQGYTVYGYDPYSGNNSDPFIISDRDTLSTMRFDGIFSNDVLEHFSDPTAELVFMKTLLKSEASKMSHCTGCYNYAYEYTRFHMYFFTGKSLDVICKNAGLEIVKTVDAPSSIGWKDYHCRVFSMRTDEKQVTN